MEPNDRLELFFSQSLDGFFFMMLDEPVRWDDSVDKETVLDYIFEHQRVTKVNDAMLAQYGATREAFLGTTPADLFRHDIAYGRKIWREFFDRGRLHIETDERRVDGTPIPIEGDYLCFYDQEGRITGHFGIQRDVTQRHRADRALRQYNRRLQVLHDIHLDILGSRSSQEIAQATIRHVQSLIPCRRVSVAVVDVPRADAPSSLRCTTMRRLPSHGKAPIIPLDTFGSVEDLQAGIVRNVAEPRGGSTCHRRRSRNSGLRSFINVPLLADGDLIGVLNVSSVEEAAFSQEAIEIAQQVASTLAVAIRQAQLRERVERYANELEDRVAAAHRRSRAQREPARPRSSTRCRISCSWSIATDATSRS